MNTGCNNLGKITDNIVQKLNQKVQFDCLHQSLQTSADGLSNSKFTCSSLCKDPKFYNEYVARYGENDKFCNFKYDSAIDIESKNITKCLLLDDVYDNLDDDVKDTLIQLGNIPSNLNKYWNIIAITCLYCCCFYLTFFIIGGIVVSKIS